MMRTLVFMLLAAVAAPAGLAAQGAPERTRTVIRDRSVNAHRSVEQRRGDEREEQTDRQTRTLRIGANGTLDVSNIAGDIVISRGGGSEATVEIVKVARGRNLEDARELLQLVQVDISERGSRAEIRTRYPHGDEMRRNNRRNVNVSVNFTITAPAGARVIAHSISGNISAKDIRGEVSLESVSGNIEVHNAGRVAAAKSISGDVSVADTEIEGLLEASSASGSVRLRRVKARRLDVGSISGDVVIEEVDCDQVEAQSVSGNVRFSGPLERNGRYEMTSHSGEVHVTIQGGAGFELEASSFSGRVRSDLPLNSRETGGGRRERSLRGVYGDGSAMLELTSFSGSIIITKR